MTITHTLLGAATVALNAFFDTPHAHESRPDRFELCQTYAGDRYPMVLVEVPGRQPRIMPYNATGAPSRSESVFDVSPFNQPGTTVSSAIWVEIARVDSHVCDATGTIIAYAKGQVEEKQQ